MSIDRESWFQILFKGWLIFCLLVVGLGIFITVATGSWWELVFIGLVLCVSIPGIYVATHPRPQCPVCRDDWAEICTNWSAHV